MDTVSTSDALIRPWRTATIVASTVALLELVLILAIAAAVFGGSVLDEARDAVAPAASPAETKGKAKRVVETKAEPKTARPATPAAPERAAPELRRGQTKVLVLNGNGIAGAAAAEGTLVQAKGYRVAAVGNAERTDYARTVVMYRPGLKPEAWRLARDLGVRNVSPLDGLRAKDLAGAHVAVILGG